MVKPKREGGMGFTSLRDVNPTMLGKQGWHLLQYPMSLMSRLLKARYFLNSKYLQTSIGSNPSYV